MKTRKNWGRGRAETRYSSALHAAITIIQAASSIRLGTENKVLNGRETWYAFFSNKELFVCLFPYTWFRMMSSYMRKTTVILPAFKWNTKSRLFTSEVNNTGTLHTDRRPMMCLRKGESGALGSDLNQSTSIYLILSVFYWGVAFKIELLDIFFTLECIYLEIWKTGKLMDKENCREVQSPAMGHKITDSQLDQ